MPERDQIIQAYDEFDDGAPCVILERAIPITDCAYNFDEREGRYVRLSDRGLEELEANTAVIEELRSQN